MQNELATFDELSKGLTGSLEEKTQAISVYISEIDPEVAELKRQKAEIDKKLKSLEWRKDEVKQYFVDNMKEIGLKSIKSEFLNVTLVAGREVVSIDDEKLIPDEYLEVKTVISPKKAVILADLKAGISIDGCSIKSNEPTVRIK